MVIDIIFYFCRFLCVYVRMQHKYEKKYTKVLKSASGVLSMMIKTFKCVFITRRIQQPFQILRIMKRCLLIYPMFLKSPKNWRLIAINPGFFSFLLTIFAIYRDSIVDLSSIISIIYAILCM